MVAKPLSIAQAVLSADTLHAVMRKPFGPVAWKILDRWAFYTPQKLKDLEGHGLVIFLTRLLEQQRLEVHALADALLADSGHLAEHEILELAGVKGEL